MKAEHTWAPFMATKWTGETEQGHVVGFKREEEAWTFSARLLQQGLLCSAWQRGRVTEQTAGASAEEGESRDDPPVLWLSEGWLSQSCVVSKWHEHLGFKNHSAYSSCSAWQKRIHGCKARERKILQWGQGWHSRRISSAYNTEPKSNCQTICSCHVIKAPAARTDGRCFKRNK